MTKPELKLEAGKYYRTRAGLKAYVGLVATPEQVHDPSCMAMGWIDGGLPRMWCANGIYTTNCLSEWDLIEEWREPRMFTRDILVLEDHDGNVVYEEMDPCTTLILNSHRLLARRTVEITEGEGL